MRRILILLFVAAYFAIGVPAVSATEENAATGCSVPHRTVAAIIESMGPGESSTAIPDPIPYAPPEGTVASPEIESGIEETAQAVVDCVNSGDLIGFLSLMSNDFLRTYLAGMGFNPEELARYESTYAPVDTELRLREVRDVTELSADRVAALVLFEQGNEQSPELTSLLTFVQVDGRWQIDLWQPVIVNEDDPGVVAWHIVTGPGFQGAVAPLDQVASYVQMLSGAEVQGMWTPSDEQITELESELVGYLETAPNATERMREQTGDYLHHYVGYVSEGHAYILVNAFCGASFEEWMNQPIMVMDGGDCFFNVRFDPDTGGFSNLYVNGFA